MSGQNRPPAVSGLWHVALFVQDFAACEKFYVDLMGMKVEWRPDSENLYLTSGRDNLALHQAGGELADARGQRLDHIGFALESPDAVDAWYDFLLKAGVSMKSEPRTHRDGARSFYCSDPDGTTVQMIYHAPMLGTE